MRQKHRFLSFTKNYGRYKIYMTQHIFSSIGSKKYGPINWVIFLDDQHIVLNTYINEHKVKIDENFMDEHWNIFVTKFNYKIDVWSMVKDCNIEKFNDYRECLLPHTHDKTLVDIDKFMHEADVAKKEKKHTIRKVEKVTKKVEGLLQDLKQIK